MTVKNLTRSTQVEPAWALVTVWRLRDRTMGFVSVALRNRTFLCAAIVVTAVIVILSDGQGVKWDLWDIFELLMLLFGIAYLRAAEPDEEFRVLVRGMLFALLGMMVVAHIFG